MLGLVVAFVGIFLSQVTGNTFFDGAASIIIGLILGGTAIWLAYETKGLLIGESADPEIVDEIRRKAASLSSVGKVNEVLTLHMGPDFILVAISIDFADHLQAGDVERAIAWLDAAIKRDFSAVKRVFVEPEEVPPQMEAN